MELARLQVAVAAADSRRQLAEDRSKEAERVLTQLRQSLDSQRARADAAEQLASQVSRIESVTERMKHMVLVDVLCTVCSSASRHFHAAGSVFHHIQITHFEPNH